MLAFLEVPGVDWVPLAFAVVLAGAVGLEREIHGRPAGLRTHILVCLCSTMLISASRAVETGQLDLGETGRVVFDPNRMGAGIVTGIGFLGAATVLRIGDLVRGITTAACIWYVAGLGIVIGREQYALATTGTVAVMAVLLGFNRVTHAMSHVVYRRVTVRAMNTAMPALAETVRAVLEEEGLRVLDVAGSRDETGDSRVTFFVSLRATLLAPEVVDRVSAIPGVKRVSWSVLD